MSIAKEFTNPSNFAFRDYSSLASSRKRVDDCLAGQKRIKEEADKYLPPDKWQNKNRKDYAAYLFRALFFNFTRKALNRYVGMLDMGEPDITFGNENRMAFLRDKSTAYGTGLKALQRKINIAQLKHGLCGLLLESTGNNDYPFIIQQYHANDFLRTYFVSKGGASYAKFVLLDETSFVYDMESKKDVLQPRLRVLGLDSNGEYYQAGIRLEDWEDFDIDEPGNIAIYPDYLGKRFDRIPFTWCGVSSLSGSSFDEPPILNVADAEISLYQLYADFRQVIYMTGQSPLVVSGFKGKKVEEIQKELKELIVGSGAIAGLPEGVTATYLEMAASSLGLIAQEVQRLIELCTQDALSLSGNANQSGVAVQLIQDSNISPLQIINSTAGDAITDQLRYAAKWMGLSDDEINQTRYTPSRDFAESNRTVQELAVIEGSELLTFAEKRKIFVDNGYGDKKKSIEEFFDEIEEDKARSGDDLSLKVQPGNPFQDQSKRKKNNQKDEPEE